MLRVALSLVAILGAVSAASAMDRTIALNVDQSDVLRSQREIVTVIVGNDSIADVYVKDTRTLVVTGYQVGETNLIVLDADGERLVDARVRVGAVRGTITVHRGAVGTVAYNCSPGCLASTASKVAAKPDGK